MLSYQNLFLALDNHTEYKSFSILYFDFRNNFLTK